MWPCMGYCHHIWTSTPSCYLELLDKLQKQICQFVGPSLAAFLESLAHWQNVVSLSLFYRYDFVRCSSELVPLLFSRGGPARYSDRLHDFFCHHSYMLQGYLYQQLFPCTVRFWNSLSIECFPLIYNLNDLKSRINRHVLTVGSL